MNSLRFPNPAPFEGEVKELPRTAENRLRTNLNILLMEYYDVAWRLEKLGGRTPDEARQAWVTKQAA
jgi:hypothetical protein